MYIAVVPNRKSPPALLLRESIRNGKQVQTRTLANLTNWLPERVEALRRALNGDYDHVSQAGSLTCGIVFGVFFVINILAKRLGMIRILGQTRWASLVFFLVVARIAHHGSRLSSVRWAQQHAVHDILNLSPFTEDDLYAALKWLSAHQEAIEEKLYREEVKAHGEATSLVLYDVTSVYLEGQHNELGHYGYNRDGKKGKKQIVIGLLTSSRGEPFAIKVFDGNTSDPETVFEQIQTLKKRFGITEVIFVGDRGMIKTKGKAFLKEAGFQYITALTDPQIRTLLKQQVLQLALFDTKVHEVMSDDKRYVLKRNDSIREKESRRRNDKLERLQKKINERNAFVAASKRASPEAGLKQLSAWIAQHKIKHIVTLSLNERNIVCALDEAAIEKDALLDGCYVLETDVSQKTLDAKTVDERYHDLQKVERDFRTLKTGLLEIRPVFVRKAAQTRGHVFVAMLALKLTRYMDERLTQAFGTTEDDSLAITLPDALDALSRWVYCTFSANGKTHQRLLAPDTTQHRILEALGVPVPREKRTPKRGHRIGTCSSPAHPSGYL